MKKTVFIILLLLLSASSQAQDYGSALFAEYDDLAWLVNQLGEKDYVYVATHFEAKFSKGFKKDDSGNLYGRSKDNFKAHLNYDRHKKYFKIAEIETYGEKNDKTNKIRAFGVNWEEELNHCPAIFRYSLASEEHSYYNWNRSLKIEHVFNHSREYRRKNDRTREKYDIFYKNYDFLADELDSKLKQSGHLLNNKKWAELEGITQEEAVPNGEVTANYVISFPDIQEFVSCQLILENQQVINQPGSPYFIQVNNQTAYSGQLNPVTWLPENEGTWIYGVKGDQISFSGNYNDQREISLTSPVSITTDLEYLPYKGRFELSNILNLQTGKCFSFAADVIYYPVDEPTIRYKGKFEEILLGYYAKWTQARSLAVPVGVHIKQELVNQEWVDQETTSYDIRNQTINGNDFYNIAEDYKMWGSEYLALLSKNQWNEEQKHKWATALTEIIQALNGDKYNIVGPKKGFPNGNMLGFIGRRTESFLNGFEPRYLLPETQGFGYDFNNIKMKSHFVTFIYEDNTMSIDEFEAWLNGLISTFYETLGNDWKSRFYPEPEDNDVDLIYAFFNRKLGESGLIAIQVYTEDNRKQLTFIFKDYKAFKK